MAGQSAKKLVERAREVIARESEAVRTLTSQIDESVAEVARPNAFGSRAVIEIPDLQTLMQYICKSGFEHHVAINKGHTGSILAEAFATYFGFDVYHHETYL